MGKVQKKNVAKSSKQLNKKSLKKPRKVLHNKQKKIQLPALNPLSFYLGFKHISEQIFKKLDVKSLEYCREVSKVWKNCIDNNKILWNTIIEIKGCNEAFQLACKNGLSKLLEMLLQKSYELEIDYNAKTPFILSKAKRYSKVIHIRIRWQTSVL